MPRRSWQSFRTSPRYSSGTRMVALIHGSSIRSIFTWCRACRRGCASRASSRRSCRRGRPREGAVVIRSRSYSRSSRSRMTSRCRRPRNPQRRPKPRAAELSTSCAEAGVVQLPTSRRRRAGPRNPPHCRRGRGRRKPRGLEPAGSRAAVRTAALLLVRDRVADAGVADLLDAGGQKTDLARAEDGRFAAWRGVKTPTRSTG